MDMVVNETLLEFRISKAETKLYKIISLFAYPDQSPLHKTQAPISRDQIPFSHNPLILRTDKVPSERYT